MFQTIRISSMFLMIGLCLGFAGYAGAQQPDEEILNLRQSTEELREEIMKGLDKDQQTHFMRAYTFYNIVGTVNLVERDVGKAIKACGEANPEMKDKLDARFANWRGEVDPIISEASAKVDNMIAVQDYADKTMVKTLFSQLDNMRIKIDKQIDKIPVSTPEACEYLHEKMDETQERMVTLLRGTLISTPEPDEG